MGKRAAVQGRPLALVHAYAANTHHTSDIFVLNKFLVMDAVNSIMNSGEGEGIDLIKRGWVQSGVSEGEGVSQWGDNASRKGGGGDVTKPMAKLKFLEREIVGND